jgi:MerR family transcriptional regulator, copper efflux regulator
MVYELDFDHLNKSYPVSFKISDFIKIKEAAAFLGVSPNTLRNWEKLGRIRVYRLPQNNYRLYRRTDLEDLLKSIKLV